MSTRLAILIGVSKYEKPTTNLPGCANDVSGLLTLLRGTERYDDILVIANETKSASVKQRLAEFISKYAKSCPDELFFYYTGHGDVDQDDFYFLFSDYQDTRKKQTTLSGSELDDMLRSLMPQLTIKVVDACHSGTFYVKDPEVVGKHLAKSKSAFSSVYFMFSSTQDQASYQTAVMSDFTRAFLQVCREFQGEKIRYRDVIDGISDYFSSNPQQSPQFIMQCNNTEIFFEINENIRKVLNTVVFEKDKDLTLESGKDDSIVAKVRRHAQDYCSKAEAQGYLELLRTGLMDTGRIKSIDELYSVSWEFGKLPDNLPSPSTIGRWIADSGADFFAEPVWSRVADDPPVIGTRSALQEVFASMAAPPRPAKTITGVSISAEMPYQVGQARCKPKFQNLPYIELTCVPVLSKRACALFYCFRRLRETDWEVLSPGQFGKWQVGTVLLKDDLNADRSVALVHGGLDSYISKTVAELISEPAKSIESGVNSGNKAESDVGKPNVSSGNKKQGDKK